MTRKLKVLGLALVAMCALGAMTASASQAFNFTTANGEEAKATGSQIGTHTFTTEGGIVLSCLNAHFDGVEFFSSSATETIEPTYSECSAQVPLLGKLPTTVTTNGCHYLFSITGQIAADEFNGNAEVQCAAGVGIEIHVYSNATKHAEGVSLCTYKVDPQVVTGQKFVDTTSASPTDVDVITNSNVSTTKISGGNITCGEKTTQTDVYRGETTVQAINRAGNAIGSHVG